MAETTTILDFDQRAINTIRMSLLPLIRDQFSLTRNSAGNDGSSSGRTPVDNKKESRDRQVSDDIKRQTEFLKQIRDAQVSGSSIEDSIKSSSKSMREMVDRIEDAGAGGKVMENAAKSFAEKMSQSQSELAKEEAKNITTLENVRDLYQKIQEQAEKAYMMENSLSILSAEEEKRKKKLIEETKKLSAAFSEAADTVRPDAAGGGGQGGGGGGGIGGFLKGGMGKIGGLLKGGLIGIVGSLVLGSIKEMMDNFSDEVKTQMEYGFAIRVQDYSKMATNLGMNVNEAAEFFGRNKDIMNSANMSQEEYIDIIHRSAREMDQYTGGVRKAAEFTEKTVRFIRSLGNASINTVAAVEDQNKVYKENFRALGVTASEFDQLRDSIIQNEGHLRTMASLRKEERYAYIRGIQQQQQYYKELGFNIQQVQQATEVMAGFSASAPLERMKQGAQLGAMMGTVGMGSEGNRIMSYMQRYHELNESERMDLAKMLTEVSDRFSSSFGESGGIMFEQLMHDLNMGDMFSKMRSTMSEGLEVNRQAADEAISEHDEYMGKFDEAIKFLDSINAASQTSIGLLSAGLLGGLGSKAANIAGAYASKFSTILSGDANNVLTTLFGDKSDQPLGPSHGGLRGALGMGGEERVNPVVEMREERERLLAQQGSIADTFANNISSVMASNAPANSIETIKKRMEETRDEQTEELQNKIDSLTRRIEELTDVSRMGVDKQTESVNAQKATAKNTEMTTEEIKKQNEESKGAGNVWTTRLARAQGSR